MGLPTPSLLAAPHRAAHAHAARHASWGYRRPRPHLLQDRKAPASNAGEHEHCKRTFTCAWQYADEGWGGEVADLWAVCKQRGAHKGKQRW